MGDHLHDLFEIFMMSVALGMDAFSLAIGLGLHGLTRSRAVRLCALIGVFHIGMTALGLTLGSFMEDVLGQVARWFGAFLLLGLGLHMAYATLFARRDETMPVTSGLPGMLLFSAGVSVDALSVGFSLGLRSAAYGAVSAGAFGVMGALMCGLGAAVGKRAGRWTGVFGELLGAAILIAYGVHFMWA
ncbi:MAG: manganese efflux pump [Alicyclobacillaceae bacterium]|nr:manganese efflux pump [Alicyclobacillaceae bacterium]